MVTHPSHFLKSMTIIHWRFALGNEERAREGCEADAASEEAAEARPLVLLSNGSGSESRASAKPPPAIHRKNLRLVSTVASFNASEPSR